MGNLFHGTNDGYHLEHLTPWHKYKAEGTHSQYNNYFSCAAHPKLHLDKALELFDALMLTITRASRSHYDFDTFLFGIPGPQESRFGLVKCEMA